MDKIQPRYYPKNYPGRNTDMAYKKKIKQQDSNNDNEIVIKIPFNSDLSEKFKKVSEQTGLVEHELLQKWIIQEEGIIHVLQNHGEKIRLKQKQDIEDQLADLLRNARQTLEQTQNQKPSGDEVPVKSVDKDKPEERRSALIRKIVKLREQGLTLTKIADQLNADKIPTFSGTGKWHPSTITMLLPKS